MALLPAGQRRGRARGRGPRRGGSAAAGVDELADAATLRLKEARTCYRHLAGRLGVAIADALVAEGWLEDSGSAYRVTTLGGRSLAALGIVSNGRRAPEPARRCLDWTERRPHVAGPVGTGLADLAVERSWVRRLRSTRAVLVTPAGRRELKRILNVRF